MAKLVIESADFMRMYNAIKALDDKVATGERYSEHERDLVTKALEAAPIELSQYSPPVSVVVPPQPSRWDDLLDRLTSRKFMLAVAAILFAGWNYYLGGMTATDFQSKVEYVILGYFAAEGAVDAVSAYRTPRPPIS